MKLKVLIGEKERDVGIERRGEDLILNMDGAALDIEVSEPEKGVYLFKTPDEVIEAFVAPIGKSGDYEVTIGHRTIVLNVYDPRRLRGAKSGAGISEGLAEIKSAMPGKVVKVIAAVGDEIKTGDGVVVVEAMKMQNELTSPKDGVVKELLVKVDDRVNSGETMMIIE